jgi:hypothetical protein
MRWPSIQNEQNTEYDPGVMYIYRSA